MTKPQNCKIPIGLTAALQDAGVSPAQVLASARLPARLLEIEGRHVAMAEYFALWQAIRTVSGDPNIGIEIAKLIKADLTEPIILAAMSAANVLNAFEVVSRYKRQLAPEDLVVSRDKAAGQLTLTFEWAGSEALPQALVDAELAFMVEVCRRGTRCAALNPTELHMRTGGLESGAAHADYFRCPIRLGAPRDAVSFAIEDTLRPFVTFNPQLLSALLPYLQAKTPPSPRVAVARIRAAIAERVRGQRPTVQSIGKELAMSTRALQRLLRDNGTSFRRLLDEVRNEHAHGYLSSTSFSDAEVAFLLGFEDASSFYRAFRSWNGMSPSKFRKRPMAIES